MLYVYSLMMSGPISPQHSFIVNRSTDLVIGDTALLTVHARDQFNNVITTGGARFDTKVTGSATVPITLNDVGNGTYNISFIARMGGQYSLSVLYGDSHLKNSPVIVCFAGMFVLHNIYLFTLPSPHKSFAMHCRRSGFDRCHRRYSCEIACTSSRQVQ